MRLKKFDLNLLVALDALLAEQNTTRAGKRLNLSQPAMSCALARLRTYFNDPLLTQVGRMLVPTPLGASLAEPIRELLLRTEATLDSRPAFDPASAERKFKLVMSDYVSTVLMAETARRVEQLAPRVSFEVLPHGHTPWHVLESGEVDLLLMPGQFLPTIYPSEVLFEDHYVCVSWTGNPLVGDSITEEQYLRLGHVLARPGVLPSRNPTVDEIFFEQCGRKRRVETLVGEFSVIPQYLIGSTRIATMHARLARLCARYMPLKILPLPFEGPPIRQAAAWHRHRSQDLGLIWLRDLLKRTAADLVAEPESARPVAARPAGAGTAEVRPGARAAKAVRRRRVTTGESALSA